jgi:hypothetical protein
MHRSISGCVSYLQASVDSGEDGVVADRGLAEALGRWVATCADDIMVPPDGNLHAMRLALLSSFLTALIDTHAGAVLNALLYHEVVCVSYVGCALSVHAVLLSGWSDCNGRAVDPWRGRSKAK